MDTLKNELDWSAFCYAAGELSPAEAEAFELRLADDQAAREALARAVELTQAVASAESLRPLVAVRSRQTVWSRRLAWMAIGSAASLLVAVLWSNWGSLARAPADQTALAAAWSQTRQDLAESDNAQSDAGLWYPAHLAATDSIEPLPAESDQSDDALAAAPDWMTAAVRGWEGSDDEPTDGDNTPFDGERRDN